jgi:hypothetical protein
MEVQDPRIRSLLRQADRVADSGKRAAAAGLYRQIIEEAPDTAVAWLGLAQTAADPSEQETAYQRVLELEPDNGTALAALRPSDPPAAEPETPDNNPAPNWDDLAASQAWASEALGGGKKTGERGRRGERENDTPPSDEVAAEAVADTPRVVAPAVTFCANHPRVETSLRCNKCGKPICSKCAKLTPVGYRCPECIREREDVFYNATPADYIIAAVSGLILGGIFSFIVPWIGFFALFVAPLVGTVTGKIILKLTGRRRGRWLPLATTLIFIFAGLPAIITFLFAGGYGIYFGVGFYLLIAPSTVYYALK